MNIRSYLANGQPLFFVSDDIGMPLSQGFDTEAKAIEVMTLLEQGLPNSEFIKSAAICADDGRIWSLPPPHRHYDIVEYMRQFGYEGGVDRPGQQGFLLSDNKFCSRTDAYEIAEKAGQIRIPIESGKRLTTEHLW